MVPEFRYRSSCLGLQRNRQSPITPGDDITIEVNHLFMHCTPSVFIPVWKSYKEHVGSPVNWWILLIFFAVPDLFKLSNEKWKTNGERLATEAASFQCTYRRLRVARTLPRACSMPCRVAVVDIFVAESLRLLGNGSLPEGGERFCWSATELFGEPTGEEGGGRIDRRRRRRTVNAATDEKRPNDVHGQAEFSSGLCLATGAA